MPRGRKPGAGETPRPGPAAPLPEPPRWKLLFLSMLKGAGLPAPEPEFPFHPMRNWRFDFAWIPYKLALEVDGGTWRKAGGAHRGVGALRDMQKGNAATVLGWRVLHYTPEQMGKGNCIPDLLDLLVPEVINAANR